MPVKQFKPTSAGRRGASGYAFTEITKSTSEPALTVSKSKSGGRNNRGITTIRYRGGGSRRNIRVIDFKRDKLSVPGRVASRARRPASSSTSCTRRPRTTTQS